LSVIAGVRVLLAAFLAMAETAISRTGRGKAITLEEEGNRGSHALLRLVEHPEQSLNPVLLLLLGCHLGAATAIGIVAEHVAGGAGVALATAFEIVVIFVFAEAAPKTWAVQHGERAALLVAPIVLGLARFPPLRLIARGLIGLRNILLPGKGLKNGPFVSEEALPAVADLAVEEGESEHRARALI